MAQAKTDNNGISTIMGVLNTDGATTTLAKANASTHVLSVSGGTTGSDFGSDNASRDQNQRTVLLATDASNNIIPLYVDSSGNLLVKTT